MFDKLNNNELALVHKHVRTFLLKEKLSNTSQPINNSSSAEECAHSFYPRQRFCNREKSQNGKTYFFDQEISSNNERGCMGYVCNKINLKGGIYEFFSYIIK